MRHMFNNKITSKLLKVNQYSENLIIKSSTYSSTFVQKAPLSLCRGAEAVGKLTPNLNKSGSWAICCISSGRISEKEPTWALLHDSSLSVTLLPRKSERIISLQIQTLLTLLTRQSPPSLNRGAPVYSSYIIFLVMPPSMTIFSPVTKLFISSVK